MASSSSHKETEPRISRTRKRTRNETYKESLLRRIASGDPNHPILAEDSSTSTSLPLKARSTQISAFAAIQEYKNSTPAYDNSTDLDRHAINRHSVAIDTSKTELKFSNIVSMAFLIGPDLDIISTAPSTSKDVPRRTMTIGERKKEAESAKKARESAKSPSAQLPRKVFEKRKSVVATTPATPNNIHTATSPSAPDKASLNSGKKLKLRLSVNTDYNNSMETLIKTSNINDKKRKSDTTVTSAVAKKARKGTEIHPAQVPSMSLKKKKSEATTTPKSPNRQRKVTAIPKPGKDQSKTRDPSKVQNSTDYSKDSNLSNNSHGPNPSNPPLNLFPKNTAPFPDCGPSPPTNPSRKPSDKYDLLPKTQRPDAELLLTKNQDPADLTKKRDLSPSRKAAFEKWYKRDGIRLGWSTR